MSGYPRTTSERLGGRQRAKRARLQYGNAGAFSSDHSARDIEIIFRQQFIQIVTRHTPWDFRKPFTDKWSVTIAQFLQPAVNRTTTATSGNYGFELIITRRANSHPMPVTGKNLELFNIVRGLACHYRMSTARVVSDHSAQRTMIVRRWIGTESQMIFLGCLAEMVQYQAGLNGSLTCRRIKCNDAIKVFREIDHHRNVGGLPS